MTMQNTHVQLTCALVFAWRAPRVHQCAWCYLPRCLPIRAHGIIFVFRLPCGRWRRHHIHREHPGRCVRNRVPACSRRGRRRRRCCQGGGRGGHAGRSPRHRRCVGRRAVRGWRGWRGIGASRNGRQRLRGRRHRLRHIHVHDDHGGDVARMKCREKLASMLELA